MSRVETFADPSELAVAQQMAGLFLPGIGTPVLRRVAGGLSGAAVFACQAGGHNFALKRWPPGTTAARVDEVHEVMIQSRSTLPLVPELIRSPLGATRLGWDGHHYELAAWMPGEHAKADGDAAAVLAAVSAGAEAIASFHDSIRRCGCSASPAPAVLRRLGRIEQLRCELPRALSCCDALSATLAAAANWLRGDGSRALDAAGAVLGRWACEIVPNQIVLRDVHREHVFFIGGKASGLVDFDAVARDSVAADLARWVSGFSGPEIDPEVLWDAAANGYRRTLEISSCELDLARAISEASGPILLANWVVWIALQQRNFSGCYDLVDRRVADLMRRMVPGLPRQGTRLPAQLSGQPE